MYCRHLLRAHDLHEHLLYEVRQEIDELKMSEPQLPTQRKPAGSYLPMETSFLLEYGLSGSHMATKLHLGFKT